MSDKTIDVEAQPETLAVQVQTPQVPVPVSAQPAQITAAQAKVEAVAQLTMKAYERASTLQLSEKEITALQADFPDSAFQPGAAGKEHLIYIEHAHLRDRLNQVFGPGQWAIVPRSRWAEDFRTFKGGQASRVYVEAMLLIRGCFVSEAVGEMEYYPNNATQNYGDAVEGAKTAALRRCCKELGIGLQAWKKDWCQGWWERRRSGRSAQTTIMPPPTAPAASKAKSEPTNGILAPPAQKSAESQQPHGELTSLGQIVSVVERHSKPGATKTWTAYFVTFKTQAGESEAATFDKKVADLAHNLSNTQEMAKITTGPGNKPGSRSLLKLEPAEQPPDSCPEQSGDDLNYDTPLDGNTP